MTNSDCNCADLREQVDLLEEGCLQLLRLINGLDGRIVGLQAANALSARYFASAREEREELSGDLKRLASGSRSPRKVPPHVHTAEGQKAFQRGVSDSLTIVSIGLRGKRQENILDVLLGMIEETKDDPRHT